ncbi:MAG: argininosuccinate lyase [Candidatus Tectomicrobia bacterium]|nr:argininosuccinate lyase [Candidatus Tectomicrobia bacterium]
MSGQPDTAAAAKPAKLWGGRFSEATHPSVEAFTASISFDARLAPYDLRGSMAHARMLGRCGIITDEEARTLIAGLQAIAAEVERGEFTFRPELEDVHMNIEHALAERLGPVAGKLHTARSRNDQVALDVRLYLRQALDELRAALRRLQEALLAQARAHVTTLMPGFTHLQHAQPVVLAHHLLAYLEMFERDRARLADCRGRVNVLPLGSGALAGTSFPIDRDFVARELGFDGVSANSLDAVSDRDFAVEAAAAAALVMVHLSRWCEELVLWSSSEFRFVELPDAFCTGSSMMPQKKNPDVPEIIRGKAGRVFGDLTALLTLLKSLPLAYNRDLQEDKPALFDAMDTVTACTHLMAQLVPGIAFRRERLAAAAGEGFTGATELADALVRRGLPFRQAHEAVGKLVRRCIEQDRRLEELTLEELRAASPLFDEEAREVLRPEAAVRAKAVTGGTAPARVAARLDLLTATYERERGA